MHILQKYGTREPYILHSHASLVHFLPKTYKIYDFLMNFDIWIKPRQVLDFLSSRKYQSANILKKFLGFEHFEPQFSCKKTKCTETNTDTDINTDTNSNTKLGSSLIDANLQGHICPGNMYFTVTFVKISNISAVTDLILAKLFGPNFLGA